ncbi:hypothetical protein BJ170DRAFT_716280 [Xylariales sp. AK1849]|nr:hypothetical protein BJ170DRAFT_716280 [Xylariales sp. AK1849]
MARRLRQRVTDAVSYLTTSRKYRMSSADPASTLEDVEIIALAKALAKADMICIGILAEGIYERTDDKVPALEASADPWHDADGQAKCALNWAHSIQAFSDGTPLRERVTSLQGHASGQEKLGYYSLWPIVRPKKDDWSRTWDPILRQVVTDYNDIRYGERKFDTAYVSNDAFSEIWFEVFTGVGRITGSGNRHSGVSASLLIKAAIKAIEEAGDILEALIEQSIRNINEATLLAVQRRAVTLETVKAALTTQGQFYWNNVRVNTWGSRLVRIQKARKYRSYKKVGFGRHEAPLGSSTSKIPELSSTTLHALTVISILLAFIPSLFGWSRSDSAPGTTEDADFWWMISNVVFQALSFLVFAIPIWHRATLPIADNYWTWVLILVGISIALAAIPLYILVSVKYSSMASFIGSAVAALIQVQVSLAVTMKGDKAKQD